MKVEQLLGKRKKKVARKEFLIGKRGAMIQNRYQTLEKFSIGHYVYNPSSYMLLSPNGENIWYREMMSEYTSDGTPIVQDLKENLS